MLDLRVARLLVSAFVFSIVTGFFAIYIIGGILVSPKQAMVGQPPIGLPIEVVQISKTEDSWVSSWFVKGEPHKAGVLLLHGVGSDRREMLERAKFLHAAGYSSLLIDMQAHGETDGEFISFGFKESLDARVALDYLRQRVASKKVGVIGSSMGGAAALLGGRPLNPDALVLEGVYASLDQAIENRIAIRLGSASKALSPLLSLQYELRLGIPLESVAPLIAIKELHSPVFILSGSKDRHALPSEAQALYDAAHQPKSLWFIEGAAHQDLHRYDKAQYEQEILNFFSNYL